jgi:uncharacterized protein
MGLNCLLLGASVAHSQEPPRPGPPAVRARGEATVNVPPDQVRIDIGVVTRAQTAEAAAGQNAKQTADVVATLKKTLPPDAEIQTSGYSIQPNYRQPRDGTPPSISGYTATNMVHVKSSGVATIGKVIDAATGAGANNIHGVQFTLKDEQRARGQALKEAARIARANAEALAAGLGMKIGRILNISDDDPVRVFPARAEMLRAQAADAASPTPIEPGDVQVRAVVNITAELVP